MSVKRISKNMFALFLAEVISKVLLFILMVYAARMLGVALYGKLTFALSFAVLTIILSDLGINSFLIREIARQKDLASKYFMNAFIAKIFLAIGSLTFVIIFLNLLSFPEETKTIVYVMWFFTTMSTFTDLLYSIFRAFERMQYDAFLKILRMVLLLSIGIYILFQGYGLFIFGLAFVFVEVIVFLTALSLGLLKFIRLELNINFNFIKNLVKSAFPFGLAIIFGSIYFHIDSVMLSKLRGDIEVGIYSVAYNLVIALLFIPAVYINAIYLVMSRYFKTSVDMLISIHKRSIKYLYIIGLPISVGLFFLADEVISFFYGEPYKSSALALKIISGFVFIKFVNFLNGMTLYSIDKQGKRTVSQGLAAVFNIVLNLFLIPPFGFVGAAIATLLTEIFLFIFYFRYVSQYLYTPKIIPIMIKPALASVVMALFLIYGNINLFISIIVGSLIYFGMLILIKGFKTEDYKTLKKIFRLENE